MDLNTCSICRASSREGTTIMAAVFLSACFNDFNIGRRKANVFPEPVAERIMTLSCLAVASIEACCISFRDSILRLESIDSTEKFLFCMGKGTKLRAGVDVKGL